MIYEVIFDTKEQADLMQHRDFLIFCGGITEGRTTTAWAEVKQRIDGKFAYQCLEGADYTGFAIEEYDIANYQTQSLEA